METEPPTGRREHQFIDFTKGLSLVTVVMNLRNSSPRVLRVVVHVSNVDVPSLFLRTRPENQISCFGVSRLPAYRQKSYFRTLESAPNPQRWVECQTGLFRSGSSWEIITWVGPGAWSPGNTGLPKLFSESAASCFHTA